MNLRKFVLHITYYMNMMKTLRTLLVLFGFLGMLAVGLFAYGYHRYSTQTVEMSGETVEIQVPKGQSARTVGEVLRKAGMKVVPWELGLMARVRGDAAKIKAGAYEFKRGMTLEQILDQMIRGEMILREVRFTEGWTFKQARAALNKHPDLRHDSLAMSEAEILKAVGATHERAEGLFFPDTYRFDKNTSDIEVLKRAYKQQMKVLEQIWAQRGPDTPLKSPYDALVLASVVEKETGREQDRDKVAAVFVNRLRIGMRLQSDPTTIYGLGDKFDGNLRRKDLTADTPYNTYTRNGLPPTPIALTGENALKATLNPAKVKALYFVARGDGTSEFSDDLAAHNRAVNKFQRGQ
jgi:UPF0755 protein